jgi:hypothetical protein
MIPDQPTNNRAVLTDERPVVIVPRGRPGMTYARSGNLLLPARFARRMPEWTRPARQQATRR